jgi:hypothetical protein
VFSGLLIFWIGISAFIALGTLSFKGRKIKNTIRKKSIIVKNKENEKSLGRVRELN